MLIYLKKDIGLLLTKRQMKVRIMSSRYALCILGYPYDTKIFNKELLEFKFWLILKIIEVRIVT